MTDKQVLDEIAEIMGNYTNLRMEENHTKAEQLMLSLPKHLHSKIYSLGTKLLRRDVSSSNEIIIDYLIAEVKQPSNKLVGFCFDLICRAYMQSILDAAKEELHHA